MFVPQLTDLDHVLVDNSGAREMFPAGSVEVLISDLKETPAGTVKFFCSGPNKNLLHFQPGFLSGLEKKRPQFQTRYCLVFLIGVL